MKRLFFIFSIALLFFYRPVLADAHYIVNDAEVNGVLHVEPAESPKAQEHVTLMFTISDKTHQFQIENCSCQVTISIPGKLPYTQKISTPAAATNGLYSVMIPFVFPRGGTYDISFTGYPITQNSFPKFSLLWHFNVTPTTNEIQTLKTPKHSFQKHIFLMLLVIVFFLFGLALIVRALATSKKSNSHSFKKKHKK